MLIGSGTAVGAIVNENIRVQPEPSLRFKKMWVEVISRESLSQYVAAWEELSADAIEPNVFFEPWMLLPAVEWLAADKNLSFALVFGARSGLENAKTLCGFFPLEHRERFKGLPMKVVSIWRHIHCFLCTPLVKKVCALQVVATFIDWFHRNKPGALIELDYLSEDGPLSKAFVEVISSRALTCYVAERFTRGVLTASSSDLDHLPARRRKDLRRNERQLSLAHGAEYSELAADDNHRFWIEEFLRLEAAGWKGRAGTAFAAKQEEQAFFVEMADEAFKRGRLMMLKLGIAGRPVALKCNLIAGEGSFAFKIAFDEDFSRFSPGLLLEVENIRRFRNRVDLKWMDSCATRDHFMINRVWRDRRSLQTLLISNGSLRGDLFLAGLPLVRALKRRVGRLKEVKQ